MMMPLIGVERKSFGSTRPSKGQILTHSDDSELSNRHTLKDDGLARGAGEVLERRGDRGVEDERLPEPGEGDAALGGVAQVAGGLGGEVGDAGGEEVHLAGPDDRVGGAAGEEGRRAGEPRGRGREGHRVQGGELGGAVAGRVGVEGEDVVAVVDVVAREQGGHDGLEGGLAGADGVGARGQGARDEEEGCGEGLHFDALKI